MGLPFTAWQRFIDPLSLGGQLGLRHLNSKPILREFARSSFAQPRGWYPTPVAPFGKTRAVATAQRTLEHAFLITGLQRFGETLTGYTFSLLIVKNLLAGAHPNWLFETFVLYSRLAQLFSLTRHRGATSLESPTHPWYGGAQTIVSSVCTRDPFLLAQWINKRMSTMKLFAHKRFLRLLGAFLKAYVNLHPSNTTILGFTLLVTGKISVTGNAMSRTMLVRFGRAGINNLSYRASTTFTLIRTKTGCLGLNLSFFY